MKPLCDSWNKEAVLKSAHTWSEHVDILLHIHVETIGKHPSDFLGFKQEVSEK